MQLDRAKTPTALAKIDRKLLKREAETEARKRRLEKMSPEERARHEIWQRTHRPGSVAKRAAARAEREQGDWLRGVVEQTDRGREGEPDVDVFA